MPRILLLIFLFMPACPSYAQEGGCGTPPPNQAQVELMKKMPRNYRNIAVMKAVYPMRKLPVKFHIVANSNGNYTVSKDTLLAELERVNKYYHSVGIQFFLCAAPDVIKDNALYDFTTAQEGNPKIQDALDDNCIDIFFFNSIKSGTTALCGYTYFPGGPDLIMMAITCLNGTTLAHELGHYFTLFHTHGNSNFGTTDELVDGSNCEFAGDEICDTPADPNLFNQVDDSCRFTGLSTDANGASYKPMVNNIMSYSGKKCRDLFTPMQYGRIREGYEMTRTYLCCTSPLIKYSISQSGRTVYFTDSSEYSSGTIWSFGDGTFSNSAEGSHTYAENGVYQISLESMNACGSDIVHFSVNLTGVHENIAGIAKVYPNPSASDLNIELADLSSSAQVQIYDLRGTLISSVNFGAGAKLLLEAGVFPGEGLYLLRVQADQGIFWIKALRTEK